MTYCLPSKFTNVFKKALKDGSLDPSGLSTMSSADRRLAFAKILGEDNAFEVNALFESKLLLKNQKKAMVSWAKELIGLNEDTRKDIIDKVNSLSEILQPESEQSFLADLANKKLGVSLTSGEAQSIAYLAKTASEAKEDYKLNPDNLDKRIFYGRRLLDLQDKVNSLKPNGRGFVERALDVINTPKSLLTSILHFSAVGVQAVGMISDLKTWRAFGNQFRYFASEEAFKDLQAQIITDPDYHLMVDGKLGLTSLSDKLSMREEQIQGTLLERFNHYLKDQTGGLPINIVGASQRAFTGFLNNLRYNAFKSTLEAARSLGEDVSPGSQTVREIAKAINDHTGRGAIGINDAYSNTTPLLNLGFFAIRKLSATMEMLDPINFINTGVENFGTASKAARNFRIRQLTGTIIATAAVVTLAKATGYKVDLHPTSQGFMKIDNGHGEKLDITGGNAVYLRMWSRILSGSEITSTGKEILFNSGGYSPINAAQVIGQYVRGKLSPVAGKLTDAAFGKDAVGRDIHEPSVIADEIKDSVTPIFFGSVLEYYYNDVDKSVKDIPMLAAALFGSSLESPLSPEIKKGFNLWGEPVDFWKDADKTPLDHELDKIGYHPPFPTDSINSVKLTDDQYKKYLVASGQMFKELLSQKVASRDWDTMTTSQKIQAVKDEHNQAKTLTQLTIGLESAGTDNDIFSKSIQKQLDKLSGGDSSSPVQNDNKKRAIDLATSDDSLRKQFGEAMIRDYDYGRMKSTNPIAYLGFLQGGTSTIGSYTTPLSALGMTNDENTYPMLEKERYSNDPNEFAESHVLINAFKEAGIDPKSAAGKILLGPEFTQGRNTNTLEHELMHRGLNVLYKIYPDLHRDQELLIHAFQDTYGYDKHSHELEANSADLLPLSDKGKADYKSNPKQFLKDIASVFKDDFDKATELAKAMINKGS